MSTLTVAALAAQDQAEAKEREFDRKAVKVARHALGVFGAVALYAGAACYGIVPAAPWSPVGQAQQVQQQQDNAPELTPPAPYRPSVDGA